VLALAATRAVFPRVAVNGWLGIDVAAPAALAAVALAVSVGVLMVVVPRLWLWKA
jgi:hypothetical protein